jgi:hypothetical protein
MSRRASATFAKPNPSSPDRPSWHGRSGTDSRNPPTPRSWALHLALRPVSAHGGSGACDDVLPAICESSALVRRHGPMDQQCVHPARRRTARVTKGAMGQAEAGFGPGASSRQARSHLRFRSASVCRPSVVERPDHCVLGRQTVAHISRPSNPGTVGARVDSKLS